MRLSAVPVRARTHPTSIPAAPSRCHQKDGQTGDCEGAVSIAMHHCMFLRSRETAGQSPRPSAALNRRVDDRVRPERIGPQPLNRSRRGESSQDDPEPSRWLTGRPQHTRAGVWCRKRDPGLAQLAPQVCGRPGGFRLGSRRPACVNLASILPRSSSHLRTASKVLTVAIARRCARLRVRWMWSRPRTLTSPRFSIILAYSRSSRRESQLTPTSVAR